MRAFFTGYVGAAILLIIVSCSGGGGSAASNGDAEVNATITGIVTGTVIAAYNTDSGVEAGRTTASGNSFKTFSLYLPRGNKYAFYFIENEGTENEKVYPLYQGNTNIFNISSAAIIDLGFVDTSSGKAVPSNNPLNVSGVSSGGETTAMPNGLITRGTVFSTKDLSGNWHALGFTTGSQGHMWHHGTIVIDTSGNYLSIGNSNNNIWESGSGKFYVAPNGVITQYGDASFFGVIRRDKNMFIAIMTDNGAWPVPQNSRSYRLIVWIRSGIVAYSQRDLEGDWQGVGLTFGNASDSEIGWAQGNFTIDNSGFYFSSARHSGTNTDYANNSGRLFMSNEGLITQDGDGSYKGFMTPDKKTFVAVMTDNGNFPAINRNYRFSILMKKGSGVTTSDLKSTYTVMGITTGRADTFWQRGKAAIDDTGRRTLYGNQTFSYSSSSYATTEELQLLTDGSGNISKPPSDSDKSFFGVMSYDKQMFAAVMTDNGVWPVNHLDNRSYRLIFWMK
jgi:hypothetical protein